MSELLSDNITKAVSETIIEQISKEVYTQVDKKIELLRKDADEYVAEASAEIRGKAAQMITKVAQDIKIIVQQMNQGTVNPIIKIEVTL